MENDPPQILGFSRIRDVETASDDVVETQIGRPLTVYAFTRDTDRDPVTLDWLETEWPVDSRVGSFQGDSVSIDATIQGTYTFVVTPADPLEFGQPKTLNIVVSESESAVYVSDLGVDNSVCGSLRSPCRSIPFAQARQPDAEILLAESPEPYPFCLGDLQIEGMVATAVPIRIRGCFDSLTWEERRLQPELCQVSCAPTMIQLPEDGSVGLGHTLAAGTQVRGVTLRLALDGITMPPGSVVTTVFSSGDTSPEGEIPPALHDVNIESQGCGDSCITVGGLFVFGEGSGRNGTVLMDGVNVSSALQGFETVGGSVGLAFEQTIATVTGNNLVAAPRLEDPRGVIAINAAASGQAIGIAATEATVTLDRMLIQGGLGAGIVGIDVRGGKTTVLSSTIDIVGFGARDVRGIRGRDCELCPTEDVSCDNACRAEEPVHVDVSESEIVLGGATTASTSASCIGVGVDIDSVSGHQAVRDSRIELGPDFTLARGIGVQRTKSAELAPEPVQILNNTIEIAGVTDDDICRFINSATADADGGYSGLRVYHAVPALVTGNHVRAGPFVDDPNDVFADNDLSGAGLVLNGFFLDSTDVSITATENEVVLGTGVSESIAALVDASSILLQNNILYGGDTVDSTGLQVRAELEDIDGAAIPSATNYPLIRFNTIIGGGFIGSSALTRAIALERSFGSELERFATLGGNLLDGGKGTGRRAIVDNARIRNIDLGLRALGLASTEAQNLAQFSGEPIAGGPMLAISNGDQTDTLWGVLSSAGEVLGFRRSTDDALTLVGSVGVGSVAERAAVYDTELVAVLANGSVALLKSDDRIESSFSNLDFASIGRGREVTIRSVALRRQPMDERSFRELAVVLEVDADPIRSGLYVAREVFDGQFSSLEPVRDSEGALWQPTMLVVKKTPDADLLFGLFSEGPDWVLLPLNVDGTQSLQAEGFAFEFGADLEPTIPQRIEFIQDPKDLSGPGFVLASFSRGSTVERGLWPAELTTARPPCTAQRTRNCAAVAEDLCNSQPVGSVAARSIGGVRSLAIVGCADGSIRTYDSDIAEDADVLVRSYNESNILALSAVPGSPIERLAFVGNDRRGVGLALIPSQNTVVEFAMDLDVTPVIFAETASVVLETLYAVRNPMTGETQADFPISLDIALTPDSSARCAFVASDSPSSLNFRLNQPCTATPPLIIDTPSIDIDGIVRDDGSPDLGASEFQEVSE